MLKEKELSKIYRVTHKPKTYHIDIQLDDYRDVYSDWDFSPFINRDLDEDLLDYLMGCSVEIPKKHAMVIDFYLLDILKDQQRETRSITGIRNYFGYRIRQIKVERFRMIKNTIRFLLLGMALLALAVYSDGLEVGPFLDRILSEGLFIGAWVALWEIFSIWFFKINELSYKTKHYQRLQSVPITYHYKTQ